MATSAPLVKKALFAAARTLYPSPTLVTYGRPGLHQPEQIVMILGQTAAHERGAMGPQRPRKETVTTTVGFSVYRPFSAEDPSDDQVAATEDAYTMATTLTDWLRTKPNEELSGACDEARVTETALTEYAVPATDEPGAERSGCMAEVVVTVTSTALRQ